jgi:hypothetical protein
MHRGDHKSRVARILNPVVIIVLLASLVVGSAGWYEPSSDTEAGEKTSAFLASDTDAYLSFNLMPCLMQWRTSSTSW